MVCLCSMEYFLYLLLLANFKGTLPFWNQLLLMSRVGLALFSQTSVSEDKAEKVRNYKPSHKLEKNGDTYTMTSLSDSRNHVVTFQLGQEFDEKVVEDRTAKTTFTLNGNTLTQVQNFGKDGNIITKREYFDDKLITTITRDGWDGTAIRYFKV